MQRTATAVWTGSLKEGNGKISTPSGVLHDAPYSFLTRFENAKGTNPEELIGAAHAGCFSMALAAQLTRAGFPPEKIHTTAKVHFGQKDGAWSIDTIDLDTEASIPKITPEAFQEQAATAKKTC